MVSVLVALPAFSGGGGGVFQGGAELVDVELDEAALVAFAGFEGPLLEPADDDDAAAFGQGFGGVLRGLPPEVAAQEQGVAVLPFAGGPVECPRCGCDGEVGDGCAGRGEAEFGIGGQVADDGDGVSPDMCCLLGVSGSRRFLFPV